MRKHHIHKSTRQAASLLLLFTGFASLALVAAENPQASPAQTLVRDAAEALGGLDKVMAVERLQLFGFAQYADGFGSGNLTASPYAPQKWNAHNDLQRVWDLPNKRYMERQRGYFLFPFASSAPYKYTLERQVLDNGIAFSIEGEAALGSDNASRGGDTRELRMWSLSYNPVAALQAALDPGSTLSTTRVENDLMLVDVKLADGEEFTLGFEWPTRLPRTLSWSGPNHLLGEVRYTTHWTGYVPYNGIKLPLGLVTKWDWRDFDFYRIYGEGWVVNGKVPDMAAPATVRNSAPRTRQRGPVQAEKVVDGIWRLSPGGTTVVEFADHLLLFELNGFAYDEETLPTIEFARTLVPGKPVTRYIASHHHDDHSSGMRTAVAEGLTVISHRGNEEMFREIATRPAPNFPDKLHRNPQPFNFIGVTDRMQLKDSERTLDLYHVIGHGHMGEALFAYDPVNKVMIAADILPAREWQWWADALVDNVEHYGLQVDRFVSNHMGVMTLQEAIDFLEPGRVAVQENCVAEARAGIYRTGCSPFFTRGRWVEGMEESFEVPFEGETGRN